MAHLSFFDIVFPRMSVPGPVPLSLFGRRTGNGAGQELRELGIETIEALEHAFVTGERSVSDHPLNLGERLVEKKIEFGRARAFHGVLL